MSGTGKALTMLVKRTMPNEHADYVGILERVLNGYLTDVVGDQALGEFL